MTTLSYQVAGAGGGDGGERPPRKWKDWALERETELRLEAPDQEGSLIDIKVRHFDSPARVNPWLCAAVGERDS
jgi:hypothetical protein